MTTSIYFCNECSRNSYYYQNLLYTLDYLLFLCCAVFGSPICCCSFTSKLSHSSFIRNPAVLAFWILCSFWNAFFFSPARRLFWETPDQFFFYFVFSHLANSSLLHIWGPGHSHLTLPHSRGVVWDWPMWHLEQTGCQFLLLLDSEKVRMFRQDVVVWHIYIYIYIWLCVARL